MKVLSLFIFLVCMLFSYLAGATPYLDLDSSSYYNNKTFIVEDNQYKVTVISTYKGEPAIAPMYLSTGIRCPGDDKVRSVDLGSLLKKRMGEGARLFLGEPTASYKSGQMHVCTLESVNLDHNYLKLRLLKAGPSHCDPQQPLELLFSLKDICS